MTKQANRFSSARTSDLIDRFAASAIHIGLPGERDDPPRLRRGTPGRERALNDLHAVARELRARNPVAEVLPLYESENTAVRCHASLLLASVDPEFAEAALRGLPFGAPTREVVALVRRAYTPPPGQPEFPAMTLDALLERFVDVTMRLYATRFLDCVGDPSDLDVKNEIVREEGDLLRELKARGALERLVPLLDHGNATIRAQAALACLGIATEKAIAILEAATGSRDALESAAIKRALDLWRKGQPVIWGVV